MAQKSNRILNGMTRPWMFWLLLIAASSLMVVGHWKVMRSGGTVWRGSEKIPYYWLDKVFVSEFAAKHPQGLWIKASIILFCLMIAHFTGSVIKWTKEKVKKNCYALWLEFFGLLVGLAMIGGLFLVFAFDAGSRDLLKERHHQLGFQIFMGVFMVCPIFFIFWDGFKRQMRLPRSAIILLLIAIFYLWLLGVIKEFPGMPQRLLLIMMTIWLVREHRQLQSELKTRPAPGRRKGDTAALSQPLRGG